MSQSQQLVIHANQKGYHSTDGKIYSPFRSEPLSLCSSTNGYLYFCVSFKGKSKKVFVHQLVAYEKYGEKAFDACVVVRHLDGNPKNNKKSNIAIGTQRDNMLDRPSEARKKQAIKASAKLRKFSDTEVEKIRSAWKNGAGYGELMQLFEISSKGSLHFILNNEYKTKV